MSEDETLEFLENFDEINENMRAMWQSRQATYRGIGHIQSSNARIEEEVGGGLAGMRQTDRQIAHSLGQVRIALEMIQTNQKEMLDEIRSLRNEIKELKLGQQ
jgi:hypothetical protein